MDKKILSLWLKAGYVKQGKLYPNHKGTPQGGIISPVIANMTLDGLEDIAKGCVPQRISGNTRSKINVIRYADDFIITGVSKEILQDKVKPAIESFLAQRGLQLSKEKTKISRIDQGFDFLGQNCRKYKGKMLITPAKDNVRVFKENTCAAIKKYQALSAHQLINILNPKLRGWANYHRHIVAGKVFEDVDSCIYKKLWKWMRKKHPRKNASWLVKKYWSKASKFWTFSSTDKDKKLFQLIRISSIGIRRHIKIKSEANPFDPNFTDYFHKRKSNKLQMASVFK
jgi:RNA-directed DNA polymerase